MSRSPAPKSPAMPRTSLEVLHRYGVRAEELFGAGSLRSVAFRSVESVEKNRVQVLLGRTSAWLPRALVEGPVRAGQWLRFTRDGAEVRVSVDLRATLRAESRLTDLFTALS